MGWRGYKCKRQGWRAAFDAGPTTENKRMSSGGKGATGWMTPCGALSVYFPITRAFILNGTNTTCSSFETLTGGSRLLHIVIYKYISHKLSA